MPIDSNETERLPLVLKPDRIWTYKAVESMELQAHGFLPKDARQGEARAALVFFHPGGWNMGEPAWGYEICGRYAASGMVAISFQYRLSSVGGYTPVDALADVRSAIRWTRKSAGTLGIDPNRVVGCAISAGAHLLLCAAMLQGPEDAGIDPLNDVSLSPIPNGLALESAVTNPELGTQFLELMQGRYRLEDYSPSYHVRPGLPPMCFIHGTGDDIVPYDSVKDFVTRMKEAGNHCELHTFEGTDHFFSKTSDKIEALRRIDGFFRGLGYIEEKSNG